MKEDRPARKHIPMAVKRQVSIRQNGVCKCGCGTPIFGGKIHWDHEPALRLRDISPDGTDYVPHQNDPAYLDALCIPAHKAKTNGFGTTAGCDTGKIKKERKRNKPPKVKKRWASRPMQSCGKMLPKGHPLRSRPFQRRKP